MVEAGTGRASEGKDGCAIVFGHTSGLGREVACQLTRAGKRVIGVARSLVDDVVDEAIRCDLNREEDVTTAVGRIREEFSDFTLLVFAAGTLTAHEIIDIPYETMEYLYRVNVFAPVAIESALASLIRDNGADVVNVTSSSILDSSYPMFAEYSSSKAAIAKFSADLREFLKESSARVIELCPSGFTSEMYAHMSGNRIVRDERVQMRVEDVAALLLYLVNLPKQIEVSRIYLNRKPPV